MKSHSTDDSRIRRGRWWAEEAMPDDHWFIRWAVGDAWCMSLPEDGDYLE